MTRRILKYPLKMTAGTQTVKIPANSEVVHFGVQGDNPGFFIWVDDVYGNINYPVEKTFQVVGTGWHLPEGVKYISTTIVDGYVWHLFGEE